MEQQRVLSVSNTVSIHYRVSEPEESKTKPATNIPTLILIHGVASNLTRWTEFLNETSLKLHYRIIRLDLRGHSRSQSDVNIGMRSWCDDLIAIFKKERLDRVIIIGHSLGAQVGMQLGYQCPEMIAGLVLIDPIVPSALKGYLAFGRRIRWVISLFASTASLLRRLGLGQSEFPIRDLYKLDKITRKQMATDPSANLAKLYHSPSADIKFIPVANYVRDMCEVSRPLPPLKKIIAPTLVILGKDPSVSYADKNRQVMQQLTNITISEIDADHWPLTENPVATRLAIEQWCFSQIEIERES